MVDQVTTSDKLLAIREKCAAEWGQVGQLRAASMFNATDFKTWCYLDTAIGDWLHEGTLVNGWPHLWISKKERTHLQVIEMIERAAVCALKDEGRL